MDSDHFSSKLNELKAQYDRSIGNKIHLIEELIKSTQNNPEKIKDLKAEIHKIGGTAGSFGYDSVSTLCKKMENEICEKIESGNYKNIQWLNSLSNFLEEFKRDFRFSKPFENTEEKQPEKNADYQPLVYIVDDDVDFLELIERVKNEFPMKVMVEFDSQKAMEQINNPGFNPDVFITVNQFRSHSYTGFDLIKALKEKKGSQPFISAFLLEKEDIDTRIEALQEGVNYIFRKPTSAYILLKTMSEVIKNRSLKDFKVLVVDDDIEFCSFVKTVLSEVGISTMELYDSNELFKTLEDYRPDILLLDLMLPKHNGLSILKTLRQDITYKNLIIVVVTSAERPDTSLNAYAANADDVLFKPINKEILQKRILNIANRWIPSKESSESNYTGLASFKDLSDDLNYRLRQTGPVNSYLVLFEVQDFSQWVKQYGFGAAKDLIVFISNQLQWEADDTMKCFLFQQTTFAIIITGNDLEVIENRIYNFLTHLIQRQRRWNLAFSCCIIPISNKFGNSIDVLKTAEQGLLEAQSQESGVIKLIHRLPKGESLARKEIVIVDSDEDLLKILKKAFESHDVEVKTYTEGGDALKEIQRRRESQLPSLIITERKLPDMDGMDLFLTLKNRFRTPIPCYMLTVFSADKDISDGIKQGVSEYIVKPFNISILVQKVLHQVFPGKFH